MSIKLDLQVKFGKRLRLLRRTNDLTQEQLAEKVGCSTEYISRVERGLVSPSFKIIQQLAEKLKIEPKSFFEF